MDPATIAAIVGTILTSAPILGKLWTKIKAFYGRVCKTPDYIRQLDRNQFTADLQTMLSSSAALMAAVQKHYVTPSRTPTLAASGQPAASQSQKSPAQITFLEVVVEEEYNYSSDFSDLNDF